MGDYLPCAESALCEWMRNFSGGVSASPEAAGLTAADAAAIAETVQAYVAAVALTREPASRTALTLAAKRKAKTKVLEVIRPYAQQIKNNRQVGAALKAQLKLRGRQASRAALPVPESRPQVSIVGVDLHRHHLHIGDATEGVVRPRDVAGVQIFCHLGEKPPADPLDARFLRFLTRRRYTVSFKPQQVGQRAHYFARWQTATGETGPWSQVASMVVAG